MSAFSAVTTSTQRVEVDFRKRLSLFPGAGVGKIMAEAYQLWWQNEKRIIMSMRGSEQTLPGRWKSLVSTGNKQGWFEYNYEVQRVVGVEIILSRVSGLPSI